MVRTLMTLLIIGTLFLPSPTAHAAETRVYLRIGLGGALILGGGILLWRLEYRTRLAEGSPHRPTPSTPEASVPRDPWKPVGMGAPPFPEEGNPPSGSEALLFELPVVTVRW